MKELDKESEGLLPCRKCGNLDYDFWDGKGTQAYLNCKSCGQEEGIQVTDLYDSVNDWPRFNQRTISYPAYAVEKANQALIDEWNARAISKKEAKLTAIVKELREALDAYIDDIGVQTLDMGDFSWIPKVEYEQATERAQQALLRAEQIE